MPHVTRFALKAQAKQMRESGEQVNLLIAKGTAPSSVTPFNISDADQSLDISTLPVVAIYGHIHWHPLGEIKYGEGGRTIYRKADIETTNQWTSQLQICIGVRLEDGSVMLKCAENLSETQATYTITVEGYVAISQ